MKGNPLQQNDIKDLNSNLEFLIKGIKLMQNAPMEYEMYGYTLSSVFIYRICKP